MCDSITFSSIISFIALMFSALTVYFNFFDSKSKKLSKKVSITKFRFNEKTGNKTIGDFDILSIFSVDIKNNSDKKIICEHLCLIFKYDNQCQSYSNFCPLIVKIPYKNIIGDVQYEDQNHILYPDEKKKIDLIRFLPKGKVITEKHHTTEEEITRVEPEITFIVDENEWKKLLINIVKLLFGLENNNHSNNKDRIKNILKNMELSISFVSEDDIRFDKKYIISDRDKDFIEKLESI